MEKLLRLVCPELYRTRTPEHGERYRCVKSLPRTEWMRLLRMYKTKTAVAKALGCSYAAVKYNYKKHGLNSPESA
jgi:hypothetical protein